MQIELLKCSMCANLSLAIGNERISESGCSTWVHLRYFEVDEAQISRLLTQRALDVAFCACKKPRVYKNRICKTCGKPHALRK